MKKATLQIFPEWEETGNVAAWNRIVFVFFFPDKFAWDTTQGTVHPPLSFFLVHGCSSMQLFIFCRWSVRCFVLPWMNQGKEQGQSNLIFARMSSLEQVETRHYLDIPLGGCCYSNFVFRPEAAAFLLFGSLKKNWPVGAVGRQRHFTEMGLNETSTVGTALQVPFIIIWQVLGVLVPWRCVSSSEIPTCHWTQFLRCWDSILSGCPWRSFHMIQAPFFRGYRDSPLSIGFSTFLSPSTRESTTRKVTSTCDDGPSFGLMPPGSSCAYATMIYNVYTL